MSLNPSMQTTQSSEVPSVSEFTSIPLRNRLRMELEAPVSDVCAAKNALRMLPSLRFPSSVWSIKHREFCCNR
jgi:hypothetical protein